MCEFPGIGRSYPRREGEPIELRGISRRSRKHLIKGGTWNSDLIIEEMISEFCRYCRGMIRTECNDPSLALFESAATEIQSLEN
jgi:hypothetical protein